MEESREEEPDQRFVELAEIIYRARLRTMMEKENREDHVEGEPPKTSTK